MSEEGRGRVHTRLIKKKALQVVLRWQIPYPAQFGKVRIPSRCHIGEYIWLLAVWSGCGRKAEMHGKIWNSRITCLAVDCLAAS